MHRNYLKDLFLNKCLYFLIKYFRCECDFRKDINPQHCLVAMLEKWRLNKNKDYPFGSLLTDLWQAFDCLSHELPIVELAAYVISRSAIKLMNIHLFNRRQTFYSSWQDILSGIRQCSIVEPFLLNIFLCDLFLIVNNIDFASYADDNAPNTTDKSAEKDIE